MKNPRIVCVMGTRPEILKMAPIISALNEAKEFTVTTLLTAQHRDLADQILKDFSIQIDEDFDVMTHQQSLTDLTATLLTRFGNYLAVTKPDMVIAQGDTTTVMTAALSCFYARIPFAHIEAGLRTHDIFNPFPEELNRQFAGKLATLHFAPTEKAKQHLLAEGITKNVFVVGNTIIDTLLRIVHSLEDEEIKPNTQRSILVTCHRRENFGEPLINICNALRTLVTRNPTIEICFPVHPNPYVHETVYKMLSNIERISLVAPLNYYQLVKKLKSSFLVLTDSGGLQEEAPALGKPVLVMRNESERMEGVECGAAKLVGTSPDIIVREVEVLLNDKITYEAMSNAGCPYGDGQASQKICQHIKEFFASQ